MRDLEYNILNKFEVIELKREVISILHSIQFDCCYYIEDCIIDLYKLLTTIDEMEIPQKIILEKYETSLTRDSLKVSLKEKYLA